MAWKNTLAHKLSIAYWAIEREETHDVILDDPQIKHLSFFNPEITEDLRRNEMRNETGDFLAYFAWFRLDPQEGGLEQNDAFDQITEILTLGEQEISATGDIIDAVYRFSDE